MFALTAILLGTVIAATVDRTPCGVSDAKQVFVLSPYSDHEVHRVKVGATLEFDIESRNDGPLNLRDATTGALIHAMPREAWDGDLKRPDGTLPESDGSVARIALTSGTVIVDPSATLSRQGPFLFVCWIERVPSVAAARAHVESYLRVELSDDWTGVIRRKDGSSIPLPQFRYQVKVEGTAASADGRRVGWLVDMPNCCTSYEVPKLLVILRNGKVERVFDEGQCIFDWAFVRRGAAVAYYTGVLHGSDFKSFFLRDPRTGALLAKYDYPDSGGEGDQDPARKAAIDAAPAWVRAIGSSRR